MLEFFVLLFLSLVAALYGAVVPGPIFVVTVSESLKRGGIAGFLIVAGHFMVEAVIIIVIFLGLDVALKSASVRIIIGYVGGATLILMGSYLVKTSRSFQVDIKPSAKTRFVSHGLVISGILGSCSNPHFFLWWVTTGMPIMYTSISVAGIFGFITFFVGHAVADLGWFGFVSYSVNKGKKFLSLSAIRYLLLGSAIFLISFGIFFICSTLM